MHPTSSSLISDCQTVKAQKDVALALFSTIATLAELQASNYPYKFDYALTGGGLLALMRSSPLLAWDSDTDMFLIFKQNMRQSQLEQFRQQFLTTMEKKIFDTYFSLQNSSRERYISQIQQNMGHSFKKWIYKRTHGKFTKSLGWDAIKYLEKLNDISENVNITLDAKEIKLIQTGLNHYSSGRNLNILCEEQRYFEGKCCVYWKGSLDDRLIETKLDNLINPKLMQKRINSKHLQRKFRIQNRQNIAETKRNLPNYLFSDKLFHTLHIEVLNNFPNESSRAAWVDIFIVTLEQQSDASANNINNFDNESKILVRSDNYNCCANKQIFGINGGIDSSLLLPFKHNVPFRSYKNISVHVPHNVTNWLTFEFGANWRIPDVSSDLINCPLIPKEEIKEFMNQYSNIFDTMRKSAQYYSRSEIINDFVTVDVAISPVTNDVSNLVIVVFLFFFSSCLAIASKSKCRRKGVC